ncbi:expansin A13 [Actinidia rufa]|uniref:Expansin n=1 Tax=Actinidia rufa TaxID=165716 RepID=A0A7J0DPP1_9ERIC|nr:expansin A13 [Actinidia rufa]
MPACLIQSLSLLLFTLVASTPRLLTTAHYSSSAPFPSSSHNALSEWRPARATYYAAADPRDAVGGACGYGDLVKAGYGMATAGLSATLFERGRICGACFEVRCVEDLRWCIPGTSIIVTATNFCAPNYGFAADGGGHCNPPNSHFVLPIEAFEKIAIWKAGNMPIQYRRYSLSLSLSLRPRLV